MYNIYIYDIQYIYIYVYIYIRIYIYTYIYICICHTARPERHGRYGSAWCAQRQLQRAHHQRTLSVPGATWCDPDHWSRPKWLSNGFLVLSEMVIWWSLRIVTLPLKQPKDIRKISSCVYMFVWFVYSCAESGRKKNWVKTWTWPSKRRAWKDCRTMLVFWGILGSPISKEEPVSKSIAGMPSRRSFT